MSHGAKVSEATVYATPISPVAANSPVQFQIPDFNDPRIAHPNNTEWLLLAGHEYLLWKVIALNTYTWRDSANNPVGTELNSHSSIVTYFAPVVDTLVHLHNDGPAKPITEPIKIQEL